MSDSFTRRIIEQAEALKQEKQRYEERPPKEEKPAKKPVLGQSDGFNTWFFVPFASNRWIMACLFIYGSLTFMSILLLNIYDERLLLPVLIVAGVLLAVFIVLLLLHFGYYRGWRKRLRFAVNGWDKLVLNGPTRRTVWRNLSIKLEPDSAFNAQQEQAYQAAMIVLEKAVVRRYYATDFSDSRRGWVTNGLQAQGSANAAVTYEIQRFCMQVLSRLNAEVGGLKAITVQTFGQHYTVSTPISDS